MEIQKYFEQKKEIYTILLYFIENCEDVEENYNNLNKIINLQFPTGIESDREEFEHFLRLISSIINNHHRDELFFNKTEQILNSFKEQIKQTFSNLEIFNIFMSNKRILLFLIEKEIIIFDETIYQIILDLDEPNGTKYCHFFMPEIRKFAGEEKIKMIEKEISDDLTDFNDNYDNKRRNGENESFICELIRNDSISDFISYINRINLSLNSKIKASKFETNQFLIQNEPSLIEYAAFYGSIQIFNYLKLNKVEINHSLWFYIIHSNNAELFDIIETNNVELPDNSYESCFKEAIKCHHNDFAQYIEFNHKDQINEKLFYEISFRHFNYLYFPDSFDSNYEFIYLCKYKYLKIVDLLLKNRMNEIEKMIISR